MPLPLNRTVSEKYLPRLRPIGTCRVSLENRIDSALGASTGSDKAVHRCRCPHRCSGLPERCRWLLFVLRWREAGMSRCSARLRLVRLLQDPQCRCGHALLLPQHFGLRSAAAVALIRLLTDNTAAASHFGKKAPSSNRRNLAGLLSA
ncbi:unnamed protein product [Lampetra planeri]